MTYLPTILETSDIQASSTALDIPTSRNKIMTGLKKRMVLVYSKDKN